MDQSQDYRGAVSGAERGAAVLSNIRGRLLNRFREQGFVAAEVNIDVVLDIRYRGQSYVVGVALTEDEFTEASIKAVTERFHDSHARRYGHALPNEPVELMTIRASGTIPTAPLGAVFENGTGRAVTDTREVYFERTGFVETDVYDRAGLALGDTAEGPAILEAANSTAVLPPNSSATVTDCGNIEIQLRAIPEDRSLRSFATLTYRIGSRSRYIRFPKVRSCVTHC